MRKQIISCLLSASMLLSTLALNNLSVKADAYQNHMNEYEKRGYIEIEDYGSAKEWYDKIYMERSGVEIVRENGHMFLKGESTTTTIQPDGTVVYHPQKNAPYIVDVNEDYIVIDGAKYSTDKKTLLAIPFNEKKFSVREGTEIVKMSAIMDYGDYNFRMEDGEEVTIIVLEDLTLPKSLKKVVFDDSKEIFGWNADVCLKKLTVKNGRLPAETFQKFFQYFNRLSVKNTVVPKKYGTNKKGIFVYKNTLVKYFGKAKKITVPSNVKAIAPYAFANYANIGDPDRDMESKYDGCPNLKKVVLNKKVKTIGKYAFINCKKLSKVTVPKKSRLKKVNKKAFYNTRINYKKFMKKIK